MKGQGWDFLDVLSNDTVQRIHRKMEEQSVVLASNRLPWGNPQMKESRVRGDPHHHSTIKYGAEHSHLGSKTNNSCKQGFHSSHLCGRLGFDPWVGKITWWRTWRPTPVFLPGESPWTEEPGGLQSTGLQRVGHDWATKHNTAHLLLFFNFSFCLFSSFWWSTSWFVFFPSSF